MPAGRGSSGSVVVVAHTRSDMLEPTATPVAAPTNPGSRVPTAAARVPPTGVPRGTHRGSAWSPHRRHTPREITDVDGRRGPYRGPRPSPRPGPGQAPRDPFTNARRPRIRPVADPRRRA